MGSERIRSEPAPRRRRVMGRWTRCAITALLLVVVLWVVRAPLLTGYARWLDNGQPPEHTDYVVALMGEENTRPFVAAALMRAGLADRVLVVPFDDPALVPSILGPLPHKVQWNVYRLRGIPADRIELLPQTGHNTHGEAEALAAFLRAHPSATVTVVTQGFHMRRTRWAYETVAGDAADRLRFVSAPSDGYDETNWWRHRVGFVVHIFECPKLVFYLIRYGSLGWWCLGIGGGVVCLWVACLARRRLARRRSHESSQT